MSTATIPGVERVYTDDDGNEVREWGPEIPFSEFPAGPRRCVPNPDGPGYVWLVEVDG